MPSAGLGDALRDTNPEVRGSAIDALRILAMLPDVRVSSARLLIHTAKTETNEYLRVGAINSLGYFDMVVGSSNVGNQSPPDIVCNALRELFRDSLEKARVTAASSLAKTCHDSSSDTLSLLTAGVLNDDKELAWESAFALNFLGTNAISILPSLTNVIDKIDYRTADELLRFLASLGDPAFPTLQKYATSVTNEHLRIAAVDSFGDFAATTQTNLPQTIALLSEALKDSDIGIRKAAVNSLRRVAVERKDPKLYPLVADKLRPLLEDKDEWIRDDVKRALEEIAATVSK